MRIGMNIRNLETRSILPYDRPKLITTVIKIATQNNNPKEAWKTINSLLGRSPSDTSVNELKINDAMLTSPGEIAEAFNTYFSNVGLTLANSMADSSVSFEQFVKPTQSKMLRFKLVPYSKLLNLLNSLSISKATGLDKISGKILKAAACSIASSLTYIFTHALTVSLATFHLNGKWQGCCLFSKRALEILLKILDQFQFCHQLVK